MAASAERQSHRSPVAVALFVALGLLVTYVVIMGALIAAHSSRSAKEANACKSYRTVAHEMGRLVPLLETPGDRDGFDAAVAALGLGRGLSARFPPRVDKAVEELMDTLSSKRDHPATSLDPARVKADAQAIDRWGATCKR